MSDVVVATETFSTDIGGETFNVHRGNRVPADHPMVARNPHFFRSPEQETDFAIETARQAPGEKRSSKPADASAKASVAGGKPKGAASNGASANAKDSDGDTKTSAEQPKAKS